MLLKYKDCGKLGGKYWLVVTCDDNQFGPKPTDGERGEQVEGIEKKASNSIFNIASPNSTKALM